MSVTLRQATPADVDFLVQLYSHEDVAPFLAVVRSATAEALRRDLGRAEAEPEAYGVLVVEVAGARAGTASWERVNQRSRIAAVSGYAIDPARRGKGVGVAAARAIQRYLISERGFHRLQMEVYAFNERALRHAERVGWIREGVRRKAYLRDGAWVDGVMFGIVEEDLDEPPDSRHPRSPG